MDTIAVPWERPSGLAVKSHMGVTVMSAPASSGMVVSAGPSMTAMFTPAPV